MSARRLLVLGALVATGIVLYRKITADAGGTYDPSSVAAAAQ